MLPTPTERLKERDCPHPRHSGLQIAVEHEVMCARCDAEYLEERGQVARYRNRRIQAGIPTRFWDCSFDNYEPLAEKQRRALATVRAYVNPLGRDNLTLCGRPGTGKTHLACAIGNLLLDNGKTAIYATVTELIRGIRDTWRPDASTTETEAVRRYRVADLLILDEVGVSFGTDSESTQLFDVLDGRYREERPSVIVSNLSSDGLQKSLGARLFDRLMEDGSYVAIFDWASYRRRGANREA